jgi:hypothetical protein
MSVKSDWVPRAVARFASDIIDDALRGGWMASMPAERVAYNAGIPRHQVGSRVMSLGLPARDHHMRLIEGSTITPMPRMSIAELINERRLAEALLVDP